ncbi:MAG: hypothetical protein IKT99_03150 [Oscillospiraceae bacterium]|nr:hypothetical protein [Oscillospiraceae bacterium]
MQGENEIRENLLDAGCSGAETESILGCLRSGDRKGAEKLIDASRKKQLARLHESQQCIDRLDYLRWQMRKGE